MSSEMEGFEERAGAYCLGIIADIPPFCNRGDVNGFFGDMSTVFSHSMVAQPLAHQSLEKAVFNFIWQRKWLLSHR